MRKSFEALVGAGVVGLVFAAGCATSVVEMRPAAPGTELWGYRTLVLANLGNVNGNRRDAEEVFADRLPGAISAAALQAGEAAFDEVEEEDQKIWDTVVAVSVVGGKATGWDRYTYVDFRVSVVRRADRREVLSMVIRSRAGGAGEDSLEQLLDYASQRAARELEKSGLFR